jgi:hypothetical protein
MLTLKFLVFLFRFFVWYLIVSLTLTALVIGLMWRNRR